MDLRGVGFKPYSYSMETRTVIIEVTGAFYSNKLERLAGTGEKKGDNKKSHKHRSAHPLLKKNNLKHVWHRRLLALSFLSLYILSGRYVVIMLLNHTYRRMILVV